MLCSAVIIWINYSTDVEAYIVAAVNSFYLRFCAVTCVFLPQQHILLQLPMEATATTDTMMRNGTMGSPHLPLRALWRKWVEIPHWRLCSRGTVPPA